MTVQVKGLGELQGKIVRFAQQAPKFDQTIVRDVGIAAKRIMVSEAARDAGADLRLSRFGWNGNAPNSPTLRVDFKLKKEEGLATGVVMPVPPGPWYLLEGGSSGSFSIGPRGVGRLGRGKGSRSAAAKRAAKQDLYNNLFGAVGTDKGFLGNKATGFAARGFVTHKQVKGKGTWSRGEKRAVAEGQKLYRTSAARTYLAPFR